MLRRGEIYYADLGDVLGSEQGGKRPVLIVQNDIGNFYSPTTIVLPITSAWKKHLPTHAELVPECGLKRHSTSLAEQIRTIDRKRLLKTPQWNSIIPLLCRQNIIRINFSILIRKSLLESTQTREKVL